jgi:glutamate-1-semialdehyde 2,1-aminomutase
VRPTLSSDVKRQGSPELTRAAADEFRRRSTAVIPGGVNSPVRAWNAVGGNPVPIASGSGPRVTDTSGREYVDLVGSWGAAIVGHAHPAVVDAVKSAASRGLGFGATTEAEVALAEEIARRYPPAERVRLVSTGTEASMTAVRLARATTGRELIIKFSGCYHGHADGLLVAAGSGLATAGVPDSAGVPDAIAAQTIVAPYGDLDAVSAAFAAHPGRIAAVITEAAPANMGVIAPPAGFNAGLARICAREGAVFVCDEVLTGFRAGAGGYWGVERDAAEARGEEPWRPDLVTFGKVIGGGLPVAAVAGRPDIMDQLAPLGAVYQAGTLSGNPVAVAAGRATLDLLDTSAYEGLSATADALAAGIGQALGDAGIEHAIGRAGTLLSVFLGLAEPPRDFAAACAQDVGAYASLFHALLDDGVLAPPSAFEALFVSTAHGVEDVEHVVSAVRRWAGTRAGREMES